MMFMEILKVRDGLYNAWRQGKLKMSKDDDGKPMSIPPIPPTEQPAHLEVIAICFI